MAGHESDKVWTFLTNVNGEFQGESKQRFATAEEAAKAAGEWLVVCAENMFFPEVQVRRASK